MCGEPVCSRLRRRQAGLDMDALESNWPARGAELVGQIEAGGLPTPELTTLQNTQV